MSKRDKARRLLEKAIPKALARHRGWVLTEAGDVASDVLDALAPMLEEGPACAPRRLKVEPWMEEARRRRRESDAMNLIAAMVDRRGQGFADWPAIEGLCKSIVAKPKTGPAPDGEWLEVARAAVDKASTRNGVYYIQPVPTVIRICGEVFARRDAEQRAEIERLRGEVEHLRDRLAEQRAEQHDGPTVRVRIAVAVEEDGGWAASGHTSDTDEVSGRCALDETGRWCGNHVIHYVEATLPVPQRPKGVTVEGEVVG
jgi:hypothetical protein